MIRRPPRSTRTDTLFPYTTLFRSVAAWVIATALALASPLFGWDNQVMTLVAIYCTVLLFNISGTPTAILRLYGRYHAAAYGPIGNALLRVGLCYLGIRNGAGLVYFVFVRSDERRVWNECVSRCRFLGWPCR